MSEEQANLEVIAPTIEEAIAKGLSDLGLDKDDVEVEILDEGSRGLLGLGSRQARIRLKIKPVPERPVQVMEEPESSPTEIPVPGITPPPGGVSVEEDAILSTARETVLEILEKMKIDANVAVEYGQYDSARNQTPVLVNVTGGDLSFLIGRRAETLNALQYITSIIVNKEIGRSVPLIVDVEGYRVRRENQLRQLAHRMADQAIKTGRRQILEPMPANERRIIHMELRNNPQVETESIGEEPRRKVTINPKNITPPY